MVDDNAIGECKMRDGALSNCSTSKKSSIFLSSLGKDRATSIAIAIVREAITFKRLRKIKELIPRVKKIRS